MPLPLPRPPLPPSGLRSPKTTCAQILHSGSTSGGHNLRRTEAILIPQKVGRGLQQWTFDPWALPSGEGGSPGGLRQPDSSVWRTETASPVRDTGGDAAAGQCGLLPSQPHEGCISPMGPPSPLPGSPSCLCLQSHTPGHTYPDLSSASPPLGYLLTPHSSFVPLWLCPYPVGTLRGTAELSCQPRSPGPSSRPPSPCPVPELGTESDQGMSGSWLTQGVRSCGGREGAKTSCRLTLGPPVSSGPFHVLCVDVLQGMTGGQSTGDPRSTDPVL